MSRSSWRAVGRPRPATIPHKAERRPAGWLLLLVSCMNPPFLPHLQHSNWARCCRKVPIDIVVMSLIQIRLVTYFDGSTKTKLTTYQASSSKRVAHEWTNCMEILRKRGYSSSIYPTPLRSSAHTLTLLKLPLDILHKTSSFCEDDRQRSRNGGESILLAIQKRLLSLTRSNCNIIAPEDLAYYPP